MGIVGKKSKAVNRSSCGTALGLDLVDGKFILPKCSIFFLMSFPPSFSYWCSAPPAQQIVGISLGYFSGCF